MRLKRKRRLHKRHLKRQTLPYTHCKNCGHELKGMYCHACGQYAHDINPNIGEFVWQYFENAFQFDGRAWVTLRHLFSHPGLISTEFMHGHIRKYVFPLKLYMAVAVIFGFVILAAQDKVHDKNKEEAEMTLSAEDSLIYNQIIASEQLDSADISRLEDVLKPSKEKSKSDDLSNTIITSSINFLGRLPMIMMFAMPIFAIFSMLFYRKKYKKYLPHLIFSIHVHTVFFITIMLMLIINTFWHSPFSRYLLWAIMIWVIIYGYIAAKRFFGDSFGRVLWKNICLYFLYYIFCMFIFALGFFINLCYDSWAAGHGFATPF